MYKFSLEEDIVLLNSSSPLISYKYNLLIIIQITYPSSNCDIEILDKSFSDNFSVEEKLVTFFIIEV